MEDTPAPKRFTGNVWLMFGVANRDSLLFHDEFLKIKEENPHRFRFDYALSREEKNAHGDKMYVQDKIAMHSHDLFQRLLQGAHIYFCGIKGKSLLDFPSVRLISCIVSNDVTNHKCPPRRGAKKINCMGYIA